MTSAPTLEEAVLQRKTCIRCGKAIRPTDVNYKRKKFCGNECAWANKAWDPAKAHERFLSRVEKRESGCWVYKGATDKWGYAHLGVDSKRVQAHRYFYQHAKGPIPAGKLVLHTCDNPPCVNPEHLFLGTDADNMMDKVRKGRDNTSALTHEQVREIREALKKPYHGIQNELARKYGVKNGVISDLKLGITFGWLK